MAGRRHFPQRPDAHQREDVSLLFFQKCLPRGWTCERPKHDYGIDFRVEMCEEDGQATGLELLVQLKATSNPDTCNDERVTLSTSTYNYLWDKVQVAMLVKYVQSADEAYWQLFRDIPTPPQDQQTFTVHIPRTNTLSTISWPEIKDYVRTVTDRKLRANRPQ